MIRKSIIEEAMYKAMKQGAVEMPPDVHSALEAAYNDETEPLAKEHLKISLENARLAKAGKGLVCGDTGFPLYFVNAGSKTEIEGGFETIWKAAEVATAKATEECYLRPTMVDPLTRNNPGTNIGPGMPKVELKFSGNGDGLDIIAAPKGGGSEIFGTFYKMLFPSDGTDGIKKFIMESIVDSCYAGKICPPAIIGIGIGGTADLCVKMAKEAALLEPVGSRSENPEIAELEKELVDASRELGIGPMGSAGKYAVLSLRIKTALTHTAALPVAFNAQCLVGRRWTARIDADEHIEYSGVLSDSNIG